MAEAITGCCMWIPSCTSVTISAVVALLEVVVTLMVTRMVALALLHALRSIGSYFIFGTGRGAAYVRIRASAFWFSHVLLKRLMLLARCVLSLVLLLLLRLLLLVLLLRATSSHCR